MHAQLFTPSSECVVVDDTSHVIAHRLLELRRNTALRPMILVLSCHDDPDVKKARRVSTGGHGYTYMGIRAARQPCCICIGQEVQLLASTGVLTQCAEEPTTPRLYAGRVRTANISRYCVRGVHPGAGPLAGHELSTITLNLQSCDHAYVIPASSPVANRMTLSGLQRRPPSHGTPNAGPRLMSHA